MRLIKLLAQRAMQQQEKLYFYVPLTEIDIKGIRKHTTMITRDNEDITGEYSCTSDKGLCQLFNFEILAVTFV